LGVLGASANYRSEITSPLRSAATITPIWRPDSVSTAPLFVQSPNDFRLLESALYSMDTVAERLGLHQLGYAQVSREALYQKAKEIRGQSTSLKNLHSCSNALKHGRSIRDHSDNFMTIAISTGIDPNDSTTWEIGGHDLVQVAHDGFAVLNSFAELKPVP
jgi:hypothetical protein